MSKSPEEFDSEVPKDRCGYTFPVDFTIEPKSDPNYQNSCIRDPLPDSDRCAVHADPAETEHKREQLEDADSIGGSLDGAILPDPLADSVDFSEISLLRDADLSGASLYNSDLSGTKLSFADLRLTWKMPTSQGLPSTTPTSRRLTWLMSTSQR
jgi:Pentapeptide repeats (8 copies).